MIDLGTYSFKYLNTGKITPEELFMNSYVEELYESEQVLNYNKRLCKILDAKYENSDLNKLMKTQCQQLTEHTMQ